MNGGDLQRLARILHEVAVNANPPGRRPIPAGTRAIVADVHQHLASTVGDIAERTGLAQSLVSRTVARFCESGLFIVEQDPRDRRKTLVSIDPKADVQEYLPEHSGVVADGIRAMYPDLAEFEVQRILVGLQILADGMLGEPAEGAN